MDELKRLRKLAVAFRDARDWKQFHSPKDLAIDLSIESNELLEHFRFKKDAETKRELKDPHKKEEIADEIGDCMFALLLLSEELGIDLGVAFERKLEKTGVKYPEKASRGRNLKWTEYEKTGRR